MMTELPQDLIPHILSYLPVVSLLKFKSVCKSWLSLIESPNFHCQQLLDDEDNLVLFTTYPSYEHFVGGYAKEYDLDITLFSGENFHISENFNCLQPFNMGEVAVKLVASCNGVLCLGRGSIMSKYETHHYDREFSLFNPTTKQFRTLPISPFPLPKSFDVSVHAGFGFDSKTNNYKIVRFSCCSSNGMNATQVEVYSLNTNSWKTIDVVVPPAAVLSDKCSRDGNLKTPFQNRIYCWLGKIGTHLLADTILTFDFSKEVFETLPLPDVSNLEVGNGLKLALLRENIAYICPTRNHTEWSIWMLNEYGVKESWTKLYTLLSQNCSGYPTGFLKNEKIICKENFMWYPDYGEIDLAILNPVTKQSEIVSVQLLEEFTVVPYKKTLVSLKSANGANIYSEIISSTSSIKTFFLLRLEGPIFEIV